MKRRLPELLALALVALFAVAVYGCAAGSRASDIKTVVPNGDAGNGKQLLSSYGCGACHAIPGVRNADGKVGPPLTAFRDRGYIAGKLVNTPDNLKHWIQDPQGVDPGVDMPEMGVTDQDAMDMVAYLYTLH